jgi:hypothetical protein
MNLDDREVECLSCVGLLTFFVVMTGSVYQGIHAVWFRGIELRPLERLGVIGLAALTSLVALTLFVLAYCICVVIVRGTWRLIRRR